MFIRQDSIIDMASTMSLREFSPQIADFMSDETANLGLVNFSGTMAQYKEQLRSWYDTISFLMGL